MLGQHTVNWIEPSCCPGIKMTPKTLVLKLRPPDHWPQGSRRVEFAYIPKINQYFISKSTSSGCCSTSLALNLSLSLEGHFCCHTRWTDYDRWPVCILMLLWFYSYFNESRTGTCPLCRSWDAPLSWWLKLCASFNRDIQNEAPMCSGERVLRDVLKTLWSLQLSCSLSHCWTRTPIIKTIISRWDAGVHLKRSSSLM